VEPKKILDELLDITLKWNAFLDKSAQKRKGGDWRDLAQLIDREACLVARELMQAAERLREATGIGQRKRGRPANRLVEFVRRESAKMTPTEFAEKYDVSRQHVYRILAKEEPPPDENGTKAAPPKPVAADEGSDWSTNPKKFCETWKSRFPDEWATFEKFAEMKAKEPVAVMSKIMTRCLKNGKPMSFALSSARAANKTVKDA
jgi:hypothetical protein